ncbi:energy transducer TonB [Reichenbachiella sp.]|uniref:energy transducer TonB n=1 Tax=Reichenbachiella sp. TaxID=2184521 RepID=UPI003BB1D590
MILTKLIAIILFAYFSSSNVQVELDDSLELSIEQGKSGSPWQFPGGQKAFDEYLKPEIKCGDQVTPTSVYVTFVIDEDGKSTEVKVLRGSTPDCNKLAIKLITEMPIWEYVEPNNGTKKLRSAANVKFN